MIVLIRGVRIAEEGVGGWGNDRKGGKEMK